MHLKVRPFKIWYSYLETRNSKLETSHRAARAHRRAGDALPGRRHRRPLQQARSSAHVHVRLQPDAAGVQSRRLHLFRPHAQRAGCRHSSAATTIRWCCKALCRSTATPCWPRPPTTGFNRIAWIMPFAVFAGRIGSNRVAGAPVEVAGGGATGADVPSWMRNNSTSCARRPVRRLNFDVRTILALALSAGNRVRALRLRAVCGRAVRLRFLSAGRS